MNRKQPDFQSTTVFDWDLEPQQERRTDFSHSTGFRTSTLSSGYHILGDASHASMRRRSQNRGGFARLFVACALLLGVCTVAIMEIPHYLR